MSNAKGLIEHDFLRALIWHVYVVLGLNQKAGNRMDFPQRNPEIFAWFMIA